MGQEKKKGAALTGGEGGCWKKVNTELWQKIKPNEPAF
jgi:hypothetical protein